MFRVLAIVGITALAACTGETAAELSPAQTAAPPPFGQVSGEVQTPNNLPDSYLNQNATHSDTDVVGVTHLPP